VRFWQRFAVPHAREPIHYKAREPSPVPRILELSQLLYWHAVPVEEREEFAQIVVDAAPSNMKVERVPGLQLLAGNQDQK
jgi:hypothetical protein